MVTTQDIIPFIVLRVTLAESLVRLGTLLLKVTVLLTFFFVSRTIYRLLSHPLSHLKGPRLAAATTWWTYLVDRTGYSEERFEELHRIYQTRVLRIGPNEVHITDPEKYSIIYHNSKPFLKDPFFYAMIPAQDALAIMQDPVKHGEIRKQLNPAFSRQGTLDVQPMFNKHLDDFRDKLAAVCSDGPVALFDAVRCLTMDIISEFSLGKSANQVHEDSGGFDAQWLKIFKKEAYLLAEFRYWPLILQLPSWIPLDLVFSLLPKEQNFPAFISFVTRSIRDFQFGRDELSTTLGRPPAFDKIGYRPVAELMQEALTILAGGSEPVSVCLVQGIAQLVKTPERIERLRTELASIAPLEGDHFSLLELEKLPFLKACVKESIRFGDPVPGHLPRIVPPGGLVVDNQLIPEGSIIGMSAHTMHHLPSVWGPDAAEFRPERWLEAAHPHELDRHFLAFSRGKRMCIGVKYGTHFIAQAQIYTVMAMLFHNFDLESPVPQYPGEEADRMRCPDFFTRTYVGGGPRVTFQPRKV